MSSSLIFETNFGDREFESRWNRHFLLFKDNLKLNLSEKSKEIIAALWQLRNTFNQVIPSDLTDYVIELIAKDQAHQKLTELSSD